MGPSLLVKWELCHAEKLAFLFWNLVLKTRHFFSWAFCLRQWPVVHAAMEQLKEDSSEAPGFELEPSTTSSQ